MPSEKTQAIVVRLVDFSESSCVVTLFTEDFGKVAALAKGAKRPKGPFDSALDLLARCRIVFLHKSADVLDLLTEAKLERRFRSASRDLSRLYAGYYVAELLQALTDYADPHPALYRSAAGTLDALDGESPVPEALFRFELAALRQLGFLPTLDSCALCGRPLGGGPDYFGQQAGGMLCGPCRPGQRQVVRLSPPVARWLRRVGGAPTATDGQPQGAVPTPIIAGAEHGAEALDQRCQGELRGLFNHLVSHINGAPLRLHRYLGPNSN